MTRGDEPAALHDAVARAGQLIGLFCATARDFGVVTAVPAADLPETDRRLVDHRSHMTVTMERHHGCSVGLRVVAERDDAARYAREILLVRPDGAVVQYGIVRIDLASVDPPVAAAIRGHAAPLGRILVSAGLLCDVQRIDLVRIEPGVHLRDLLGATGPLHGRVAEITVGGRPTIELLEIVVHPRHVATPPRPPA